MQAVPLAALNGSVMSAFKSSSLSPPSAELAKTLGKMASNPTVYEITATAPATAATMDHLADMDDDKCCLHGEEEVQYVGGVPSYYPSMENQSSRVSSPSPVMPVSPKNYEGNLTPVSGSSKDGSSSSSSSSSEVLSAMDDEVSESSMPPNLSAEGMCVPSSAEVLTTEQSPVSGTHVKHWTYEDQFKQLYNLSQDPERKEFLDKLFNYMQNKGTPITRVPIMAKQPLDLYKLFKLVVERGGLVEVIKKKAWRNVAKELNLPASITSAAFTMRSQYVKYLYPYECETVQLSDPQELQMAIDSNKRDRRHSENMEFVAPQIGGRGEMEACHSPVVTTNPQGIQLISSPTMALPHGSMPPFSGGFLVTGGPGGTRVVASPQLVQMSPNVPGIPIVMPSTTLQQTVGGLHQPPPSSSSSSSSLEDREDTQSHASGEVLDGPPALKRPALEGNKTTMLHNHCSNGQGAYNTPGGLIMTHGGNLVNPGGVSPHLIQMGAHGQIPIVVPTAPISSAQSHTCPHPPNAFLINSRTELNPKNENGSVVATLQQSHPTPGNVILTQRGSLSTAPTHTMHNLFQMTGHPNITGLVLPHQMGMSSSHVPKESRGNSAESEKQSTPTTAVKMPVASISIESAGGKVDGDQNGADASLVMTLEINHVIYQGVLFAKPPSTTCSQR